MGFRLIARPNLWAMKYIQSNPQPPYLEKKKKPDISIFKQKFDFFFFLKSENCMNLDWVQNSYILYVIQIQQTS